MVSTPIRLRALRMLSLLAFSALTACAPVIHSSGLSLASLAQIPRDGFQLAGGGPSDIEAGTIVSTLLEANGFRRAHDSRYRVDVALSSGDPRIAPAGSPKRQPIRLCALRRHALSIALVDLPTGAVLFRRSVEARSCEELTTNLVRKLAATALAT